MTPDQFIRAFNVPCFFHFSDKRNLESIREHGLLSWRELQNRGIGPVVPGGNDWSRNADERFGMDYYVHLCLMNEHPMEYHAKKDGRIQTSVFLQVLPQVLRLPGVRFTADVSDMREVEILDLDQAAVDLDLEVVYRRTDWSDPEIRARRLLAKRYELLVPSCVPTELIRGL